MKRNFIAWAIIFTIITAQSIAYYSKFQLSLGPRVVLQPLIMEQGHVIYKDIADEHAPLMPILLSFLQTLPLDSFLIAKLTLILLIASMSLIVTYTTFHIYGPGVAIGTAGFIALWSPVFGYGKLWHETFLACTYAVLLYMIQRYHSPSEHPRLISTGLIGILLGIALLFKQHALAVLLSFIGFEIIAAIQNRRPVAALYKEIVLLFTASAVPIILFLCYYLYKSGSLQDMTFWTLTFNFINNYTQAATQGPTLSQLKNLIPAYLLIIPFIFQWLKNQKSSEKWYKDGHALLLLASSSLTAYPRFNSFHLQASLPILAWICSTQISATVHADGHKNKAIYRFALGAVVTLWLFQSISTVYYPAFRNSNPPKIWEYSDLTPLADQIQQIIPPTESVYLLPDDEGVGNLYYLLKCTPPKPWVMTSYPWFMLDTIEGKILQSLIANPPQWVIYFPGRWGIETHGAALFNYIQNHYQLEAQLSWTDGEAQLLRYHP